MYRYIKHTYGVDNKPHVFTSKHFYDNHASEAQLLEVIQSTGEQLL